MPIYFNLIQNLSEEYKPSSANENNTNYPQNSNRQPIPISEIKLTTLSDMQLAPSIKKNHNIPKQKENSNIQLKNINLTKFLKNFTKKEKKEILLSTNYKALINFFNSNADQEFIIYIINKLIPEDQIKLINNQCFPQLIKIFDQYSQKEYILYFLALFYEEEWINYLLNENFYLCLEEINKYDIDFNKLFININFIFKNIYPINIEYILTTNFIQMVNNLNNFDQEIIKQEIYIPLIQILSKNIDEYNLKSIENLFVIFSIFDNQKVILKISQQFCQNLNSLKNINIFYYLFSNYYNDYHFNNENTDLEDIDFEILLTQINNLQDFLQEIKFNIDKLEILACNCNFITFINDTQNIIKNKEFINFTKKIFEYISIKQQAAILKNTFFIKLAQNIQLSNNNNFYYIKKFIEEKIFSNYPHQLEHIIKIFSILSQIIPESLEQVIKQLNNFENEFIKLILNTYQSNDSFIFYLISNPEKHNVLNFIQNNYSQHFQLTILQINNQSSFKYLSNTLISYPLEMQCIANFLQFLNLISPVLYFNGIEEKFSEIIINFNNLCQLNSPDKIDQIINFYDNFRLFNENYLPFKISNAIKIDKNKLFQIIQEYISINNLPINSTTNLIILEKKLPSLIYIDYFFRLINTIDYTKDYQIIIENISQSLQNLKSNIDTYENYITSESNKYQNIFIQSIKKYLQFYTPILPSTNIEINQQSKNLKEEYLSISF